MKRTERDVAWSTISQGHKCLWCGESVMEIGMNDFMCINDPDCLVAHDAEQLEAQVEEDRAKWSRVLDLERPL